MKPQPQKEKKAPEPAIKKSKPIQSDPGKKMIYAGIAAAVVLIGILIAVFSGGEKEEDVPVVVEVPRVNYDSIAQVRILEAMSIKENADTIIQNHPDEYTDASLYNKVEDIYAQALTKLDDAMKDKDSLNVEIANSALQQKTLIKNALLAIYKNLDAGAEYVEEFRTRADAIKPLIGDLLTTPNNENTDNETN